MAVLALPYFEAEAKERQRLAGASHLGNQYTGGVELEDKEKFPEPPQPQSRDLAAATTGVNPRYVSDAKRVETEAPEKFKDMLAGNLTLQEAKREMAAERNEPPEPQVKWHIVGPMLKAALEQIRDAEDREAAIEMALRLLDEIWAIILVQNKFLKH